MTDASPPDDAAQTDQTESPESTAQRDSSTPPAQPAQSTQPAEPAQSKQAAGPRRSVWRELPFLVAIAIVLAILIKTFLVQAFYIPSASMEPTLEGGPHVRGPVGPDNPNEPYDRILVNKLVYRFRSPRRGEIVVFKKPPYWTNESTPPPATGLLHVFQRAESAIGIPVSTTEDIVKRVIGVPGDVIKCTEGSGVGTTGTLTVNGKAIAEPFIYPGSNPCENLPSYTVTVPPNHLWVMGDNRDNSSDSSANMDNPEHGTIPISDVIGRAFVVIWPPQDWRTLGVPPSLASLSSTAAIASSPPAIGLAGALPITAIRRRRIRRREARRYFTTR